MNDIEIRVKKTVAEKLGVNLDTVANNKSFIDLGVNGGQMSEMFKALENEFQMRIGTEQPIGTIQSAIDYAKKHANVRVF